MISISDVFIRISDVLLELLMNWLLISDDLSEFQMSIIRISDKTSKHVGRCFVRISDDLSM